MRRCQVCNEPAVKTSLVVARDGESRESHLCYVHAGEEGVFYGPVDDLRGLAEQTGYPVNGMFFVAEAVARAKRTLSSAGDVSEAIICAAKKRFGRAARVALEEWKIVDRPDIGIIYCGLVKAGLVKCGKIDREEFDRPFALGDVLDAAIKAPD